MWMASSAIEESAPAVLRFVDIACLADQRADEFTVPERNMFFSKFKVAFKFSLYKV